MRQQAMRGWHHQARQRIGKRERQREQLQAARRARAPALQQRQQQHLRMTQPLTSNLIVQSFFQLTGKGLATQPSGFV